MSRDTHTQKKKTTTTPKIKGEKEGERSLLRKEEKAEEEEEIEADDDGEDECEVDDCEDEEEEDEEEEEEEIETKPELETETETEEQGVRSHHIGKLTENLKEQRELRIREILNQTESLYRKLSPKQLGGETKVRFEDLFVDRLRTIADELFVQFALSLGAKTKGTLNVDLKDIREFTKVFMPNAFNRYDTALYNTVTEATKRFKWDNHGEESE